MPPDVRHSAHEDVHGAEREPPESLDRRGGPLSELADEEFSAIISSTEPIAVERAMYSTTGGLTWSAGTNAGATRMLPVP